MSTRLAIALSLVALLSAPAASQEQEQSVVELAAKEKERRKNTPKGTTYTEEDLRRAGRRAGNEPAPAASKPQAQTAGAAAQAEAGETPDKTEEEIRAEEQDAWREKLQKANEEAEAFRERIDMLQTSLNDLTQNLYTSNRLTMMRRLEQAKQDLVEAEQTIQELEAEGVQKRY
jgi:hypothetical protein